MLFFFKQKTAYEMRISDWSSDVCSSDLLIYQHKDYSFSLQPSLRYNRQADQLQEADSGVTARATRMLGATGNITGSVFYTNRRSEPDRSRDARAVGATLGFNTLLAHNLKVGADYTLLREHADDDVYSRRMNGPSVYIQWKPSADLQFLANYR